jgi:hypothetical protein
MDYIRGEKIVLPQFTVAEITKLPLVTESLKKEGLGLGLGFRVMPTFTKTL